MASILIVTNSLSGGGAERAMNLLARELAKLPDFEVNLLAINSGPEDLVDPMCPVETLNRNIESGTLQLLKTGLKFRKSVLRHSYDLVILNCELPEFLGLFLPIRTASLVVEHTTRPWIKRPKLGSLVRTILRLRGTLSIPVSEKIKEYKLKQRQVIPNIIDQEIFQHRQRFPGELTEIRRLVFIGRNTREKRLDLFLELLSLTNLNSAIFGPGTENLTDSENRPSGQARTEIFGPVRNPWNYIESGDLIVVTSDYEGDGLVILEALALDIPILLRNTADLLAMNLPQHNYFANKEEFVQKIQSQTLDSFKVTSNTSIKILESRNPEVVTNSWIELIHGEYLKSH